MTEEAASSPVHTRSQDAIQSSGIDRDGNEALVSAWNYTVFCNPDIRNTNYIYGYCGDLKRKIRGDVLILRKRNAKSFATKVLSPQIFSM